MKKFLFLSFILSAVISTTVNAQSGPQAGGAPDPAAMLQQMKEKQVPGLVEKAGLTTEQANKVIELNFEMRMAASALPNDADRSAKLAELKAAKEKKMSEVLTAEQIKTVNAYYADMGKNSNREKKTGN